jgi:hypothetical protein
MVLLLIEMNIENPELAQLVGLFKEFGLLVQMEKTSMMLTEALMAKSLPLEMILALLSFSGFQLL